MNKHIIVGRLSRDPESRTTPSGMVVVKMSVPTDDGWGEKKKTTWHNLVAFGKTAEFCGASLKKGSWVSVEGRLDKDKWEDKEGYKRESVSTIVDRINFVGPKQTAEQVADEPHQPEVDTSDIPF